MRYEKSVKLIARDGEKLNKYRRDNKTSRKIKYNNEQREMRCHRLYAKPEKIRSAIKRPKMYNSVVNVVT